MDEYGPTASPQPAGGSRRPFRRLEQYEHEPRMTAGEMRIAGAVERTVDERLADGLSAIEEQATALMREIASEIWRSSGADARPEQERIVSLLSRDQAIRSLLTSSDERFQALAVRSERLEDSLGELAQNGRATRASIEASVAAIRQIADSPTLHGVEGIRVQLEQVEHHIAAAFEHFDERDRAITEGVLGQVKAHGELVARETARLVEVMKEYVQTGAEAMAILATRVEEGADALASQDLSISEHVGDMVAIRIRPVAEQMDMMAEKVGLHGRDQDEIRAALERLVEARITGLAQLTRSDSEALRRVIEERSDGQAEALRQVVEERSDAQAEAFGRVIEERSDAQAEALRRAIEERSDAQAEVVREAVDWRMAAFAERIDEQLERAGDQVASRASQAAQTAIATSLDQTMEHMNAGIGAIDGIDTMMAEGQAAAEERVRAHIDDRMTAIARLIRSDNQVLAASFAKDTQTETLDPELLRQTIRTIKELQAGMATDVRTAVDRRFESMSDQLHQETQSTTESMVKVAELLGEKIDRLTVRVDEGVGNDLQVVIDRMGDAIQAMSTVRRSA